MSRVVSWVKADLMYHDSKIAGLGTEFVHDRGRGTLEDLGKMFADAQKALENNFGELVEPKGRTIFIRGFETLDRQEPEELK